MDQNHITLNHIIVQNITRNDTCTYNFFLTYSGIQKNIPVHLKTLDVDESEITLLKFQYGEKSFDPARCNSKQFYELLISNKGNTCELT